MSGLVVNKVTHGFMSVHTCVIEIVNKAIFSYFTILWHVDLS
jgi:hypothetical protein